MAKLIKLTPEIIEEVKKEFDAYVKDKISDGRISFQKTVNTVQRKATVYFVESAYRKFQALVKEFDKEVAWHGIAYRGKDASKDEYFITDILVYPQEVTGATVTTDQNKYQTWLMNHDDETFNNIRMQGHSHVNMGVTPSGVDENLYESILAQLDDTMFYIFMIWNKKNDKTCKIYDLAKNILFDTTDCEIKIITVPPADVKIEGVTEEEQGTMLEALNDLRYEKMCKQFVDEAKKLVTTKTYATTYSRTGTSGSYGNYGGYGGYYNGYYGTSSTTTSSLATTSSKKDDDSGKKGKRKGKRKESSKTSQGFYYDDDDDDIYGYNEGLWT
jgi:hypothetical protein